MQKLGYQIKPDYVKATEDVCRAAVLADATDWHKSLDGTYQYYNWFPHALSAVNHTPDWDPVTSKLPSWMPDWGNQVLVPIHEDVGVEFAKAPTAYHDKKSSQTVTIQGCVFDTVDFVTGHDIPYDKLLDTLHYTSVSWSQHIKTWRKCLPLSDTDVPNYRFLEALACEDAYMARTPGSRIVEYNAHRITREIIRAWREVDMVNPSPSVATEVSTRYDALAHREFKQATRFILE